MLFMLMLMRKWKAAFRSLNKTPKREKKTKHKLGKISVTPSVTHSKYQISLLCIYKVANIARDRRLYGTPVLIIPFFGLHCSVIQTNVRKTEEANYAGLLNIATTDSSTEWQAVLFSVSKQSQFNLVVTRKEIGGEIQLMTRCKACACARR